MLRKLSIRNFAIIDDLSITFEEGLTVLSGETGAGKSIIINAVNLILGRRANAQMIRTGAETAELEAFFDVPSQGHLSQQMAEYGLDASEGLIVRRVISRNNRHKNFINDRLVTMQLLNTITDNLASISGQHAHQRLLKEEAHLQIIDQFGGLLRLRSQFQKIYQEIKQNLQELEHLKTSQSRRKEQLELYAFQKKEIIDAAIEVDEDQLLEKEIMRLRHAESLFQAVKASIDTLYDSQGAVLEKLSDLKNGLEKSIRIDPALSSVGKGLADTIYQLEDITEELRTYLQTIHIDPQRLEAVEERMDLLTKLKRKYGGSIADIGAHLTSVTNKLEAVENLDENIAQINCKLADFHAQLTSSAQELSKKRQQTAKKLAVLVEKELASLKMGKTRFSVFFNTVTADADLSPYLTVEAHGVNENGQDRVVFMIAPNVGEDLKPLAAIASGGELSRIVLALKAILAETESVQTIIFDEVDAGIGGAVAEKIGKKLAALAHHHQIICITHLPQIAKYGSQHFRISKKISSGRTQTSIKAIDQKERVQEIARMLGGDTITDATLRHAEEMLGYS